MSQLQTQFGQPEQFNLAQQIQDQVHQTMAAYYQQAEVAQQAAAAAQPVSDPVWDKLLARETVLLDAAIKSNKRLVAMFGKHSFEDAIAGKAGAQVQILAQRIDAALDVASDDGNVKMPLTDMKEIVAAMKQGVQEYARLAVGQSNEQSVAQFAAEVVAGGQSSDRSESSGDGEVDYERQGPISNFSFETADQDRAIADHFKSTVEQHGGAFEESEPTIGELAGEATGDFHAA